MANKRVEHVEGTAKNQPIFVFLDFADLKKFTSAFEILGVSKFDHLQDVKEEDLRNFGMYFDLIFVMPYLLYCSLLRMAFSYKLPYEKRRLFLLLYILRYFRRV